MTDKELLEYAARAAGVIHDKGDCTGGPHDNDGFDILGNFMISWHERISWNPLTDDGDALRLAVKLGMRVKNYIHSNVVVAYPDTNYGADECYTDNPYAATRRAIVRAAAEIGKGKQ